jgi:hypothetical protein
LSKAISVKQQKRPRDAFDIYYVLANPNGPHISAKLVQLGQTNIWVELKDSNTWVGLVVAILLVVVSMWILDNWKWAHPSRGARIGLLVVSIALTAIVDPFGRTFKRELLEAYEKAHTGEAIADVLKPFQHESPSLVVPHTDQGNQLDCIGDCWLRLSYEVTEMFGERWISLDFDRDLKLIKKSP